MKTMSSKEIKDHYGAFAEVARREPVVHTSHGRPTLVTISIDRALNIPELHKDILAESDETQSQSLSRFLAMGGIGVKLIGEQPVEILKKRSAEFRGN
jgi:hypothetical protein